MPADLLIRGADVVTARGVERRDVLVEGGRIVEIAESVSATAKDLVDGTGLHLFPGLIDSHVHFNEPGRTDWEGVATGSAALVAGGGTCFFDMPLNSSPPVLDGASFDAKRKAAEASSVADFGLWGGLTPGNLDRLPELAERGVVGFKAFMSNSGIEDFSHIDETSLKTGMKIAAGLGKLVAVHAESDLMTGELTQQIRARGGKTWRDYLSSRPVVAELAAIDRAIDLAGETGCRLHIVHVSHPLGALRVRDAIAGGVDVTCETCPHYLSLTEDDLERLGACAKCAPPVRSSDDVAAMWKALAAGEFDFVASDHSPAPASMKTGDDAFAIWGGIAGVQSTLSILLSHEPPLPLNLTAALTSANVAKRFWIYGKGAIETGYDADLTLVDLREQFDLERSMLHDRHKLSPYVGRHFRGRVRRTWVRGRAVFDGNHPIPGPWGRLIVPQSN